MSEVEVTSVKKSMLEQKRLRGRNVFDVVNQVVERYNSSEGWALVKVVPNLTNLDVYLERSTTQNTDVKEVTTPEVKEVTTPEVSNENKDVLVEKKAEVTEKPKTSKKSSATTATKLVEAKKV